MGTATLLSTCQDDDQLPDESVALYLQGQQMNLKSLEHGHAATKAADVLEDVIEETEEDGEYSHGVKDLEYQDQGWNEVKQEQWDDDEWREWMKWNDQGGWHVKQEKEPTEPEYPPWAYRSFDDKQRQAGINSNIGRADKLGGQYTSQGYQDPSGRHWESLVCALII